MAEITQKNLTLKEIEKGTIDTLKNIEQLEKVADSYISLKEEEIFPYFFRERTVSLFEIMKKRLEEEKEKNLQLLEQLKHMSPQPNGCGCMTILIILAVTLFIFIILFPKFTFLMQ
ncbi:MAG TPA: hypothetical protein P5150_03475 [Candidatus Ratteibacteria bacterium]|nr:hypothetical protein [bacterium]HRR95777.1 hypothetical protein [Candidatus Ratteibacteria bacterium]